MGGVRGDVMDLGFFQTRIMEMGEPPREQPDAPAVWVRARQYTGRIVTITNDKIFDMPVYNYTLDFPFIWDEMTIPVKYDGDQRRAEQILLETAEKHTVKISEMSKEAIESLERRYVIERSDIKPRVFWRLTDNWVELSVRFVVHDHNIRHVKDSMSREILDRFNAAGIQIASATYEIVGLPQLKVQVQPK
jgi:small-conductance mechanosensitive channel